MKALLVDDERLARAELRCLLAAHPQIQICGEARTAGEALEMIPQLAPDVLFLDIQMPGMSGFELLEQLEEAPQVIFTTAFDQHAVQAFEANALDYLLKPIAPERLAAAVARLQPARAAATSGPTPALERVFVRDGGRCWLVALRDIELFESDGNYTRVHFAGQKPLILRSLAALEARLDPGQFFRASRRHLVNLQAIEGVSPGVADNLVLTLRGGVQVEMSRRQSTQLRERLSL